MSAEKAKVPASTPKAHPVPTAATRTPPITGPAIDIAIGRTNCPSELASTRRVPGTIIGRMALNDGWNTACPAPYTATRAISNGIET
jgi:hypothetical protein